MVSCLALKNRDFNYINRLFIWYVVLLHIQFIHLFVYFLSTGITLLLCLFLSLLKFCFGHKYY